MVSLKQDFLFIAFFIAISVNISWDPEVMALRDFTIDVAEMKVKLLLPFDNDITCYRRCNSHSDCGDGIFCRTCSYSKPYGFDHGIYDCSTW
ncbi:hypothetical protein P3L10_014135 [Capsicum annuum]